MKSIKFWLILICLLVLLLGVKHLFFPSPQDETGGGPLQKPPPPVKVMLAVYDTLVDGIYVNGTLSGTESIDLQPETQGKVVSLFFEEGEQVSKGKLLMKLNDAELQANLKKLESQILTANQKVGRLEKLLEKNGVSKEEYENALSQLQSLMADKTYTEAMIGKTELRAPFTGRIGLRNVSPGSMVNINTVIATLEQTDPMKLDFSVPEKYAQLLRKGSRLSFSVENLEGTFQGIVYAIEPRIDAATRSLRLRARAGNSSGDLKSGSFARVNIVLQEKQNAIMLPTEALLTDMKSNKVFLVKNGEAFPAPVKTGLRGSSKVEILSGLNKGDSVIVSGQMQLKPGQKVRVIP